MISQVNMKILGVTAWIPQESKGIGWRNGTLTKKIQDAHFGSVTAFVQPMNLTFRFTYAKHFIEYFDPDDKYAEGSEFWILVSSANCSPTRFLNKKPTTSENQLHSSLELISHVDTLPSMSSETLETAVN